MGPVYSSQGQHSFSSWNRLFSGNRTWRETDPFLHDGRQKFHRRRSSIGYRTRPCRLIYPLHLPGVGDDADDMTVSRVVNDRHAYCETRMNDVVGVYPDGLQHRQLSTNAGGASFIYKQKKTYISMFRFRSRFGRPVYHLLISLL